MAKKAREGTKAAVSPEELERRRQRKLEVASRRGLVIRWSEYPQWIKLHDPLTGEWHEVEASECPPGVVEAANGHRRKEPYRRRERRELLHRGKLKALGLPLRRGLHSGSHRRGEQLRGQTCQRSTAGRRR